MGSQAKKDMLTKSDVKARDWTDGAIRQFLGDPDSERRNPRGANSPTIKLFERERVIAAEQSADFQAWQEKTHAKREAARARGLANAEKKRQALRDYIDALPIELPVFSSQKALYKRAVEHYNDLQLSRDGDGWASVTDDAHFLKRITVNMLRHTQTDYEAELDRLFGVTGRGEGYHRLKQRINDAIYRAYPYLVLTEEEQAQDRKMFPFRE